MAGILRVPAISKALVFMLEMLIFPSPWLINAISFDSSAYHKYLYTPFEWIWSISQVHATPTGVNSAALDKDEAYGNNGLK